MLQNDPDSQQSARDPWILGRNRKNDAKVRRPKKKGGANSWGRTGTPGRRFTPAGFCHRKLHRCAVPCARRCGRAYLSRRTGQSAEPVGDKERGHHLEGSTGFRDIANGAFDRSAAETDGSGFENSSARCDSVLVSHRRMLRRAAAAFNFGSGGSPSARRVLSPQRMERDRQQPMLALEVRPR
jgi:hypothetical protein